MLLSAAIGFFVARAIAGGLESAVGIDPMPLRFSRWERPEALDMAAFSKTPFRDPGSDAKAYLAILARLQYPGHLDCSADLRAIAKSAQDPVSRARMLLVEQDPRNAGAALDVIRSGGQLPVSWMVSWLPVSQLPEFIGAQSESGSILTGDHWATLLIRSARSDSGVWRSCLNVGFRTTHAGEQRIEFLVGILRSVLSVPSGEPEDRLLACLSDEIGVVPVAERRSAATALGGLKSHPRLRSLLFGGT